MTNDMAQRLCGIGLLAAVACGGRTEQLTDGSAQNASPAPAGSTDAEALSNVEFQARIAPSPNDEAPVDGMDEPAPVDAPSNDMTIANAPADECGHPNYPPTELMNDVWTPFVMDPNANAFAFVAELQSSMVGSWQGLVHTPWTTPYRVEVTFTADGHYSARCTELPASCCTAFYYGTDDDTEIKQYRLESVSLDGGVSGEIDIAFDYGDEYDFPAWQGLLSQIERDASGDGLRFEFWTSSGYGALEFDLRRATAE